MFRGLDDAAEGYPSDILFCNETLENNEKTKLDSLFMRCRMFAVLDWNPKYTQHWCFDLEKQPNTFFTHSTYKNNKHLEQKIINKIESYNPDEPKNIKNQTADDYRWRVYGLGLRAAPEGVIFQYINYIDEFPPVAYHYGLDFGFTVDPTSLVRYAETRTDIYLELLCYEPIETPELIDAKFTMLGIDQDDPITADSADRYNSENHGAIKMVRSLKELGWSISKVSKNKSVMFWLNSMKQKRINIVKDKRKMWLHAKIEEIGRAHV
jgi:phage terminase large subunit